MTRLKYMTLHGQKLFLECYVAHCNMTSDQKTAGVLLARVRKLEKLQRETREQLRAASRFDSDLTVRTTCYIPKIWAYAYPEVFIAPVRKLSLELASLCTRVSPTCSWKRQRLSPPAVKMHRRGPTWCFCAVSCML